MPRIRKIHREPERAKNWFVVDANFLANRFIPATRALDVNQRQRIELCRQWWDEIELQVSMRRARVYVPDICIAEAFKVLAEKYYMEKWYKSSQDFNYWRNCLRKHISISPHDLRRAGRHVEYHDVESNRDIIVSVDRFYELFFKHGHKVSVPDLIVVTTAKYLIDFFDADKAHLHIVTLDRPLRAGCQKIQELPNAYDPTRHSDARDRVFQ